MPRCGRCRGRVTRVVFTRNFGEEHLCKGCARAVLQDGQTLGASGKLPNQMTFTEVTDWASGKMVERHYAHMPPFSKDNPATIDRADVREWLDKLAALETQQGAVRRALWAAAGLPKRSSWYESEWQGVSFALAYARLLKGENVQVLEAGTKNARIAD